MITTVYHIIYVGICYYNKCVVSSLWHWRCAEKSMDSNRLTRFRQVDHEDSEIAFGDIPMILAFGWISIVVVMMALVSLWIQVPS